MGVFNIIWGSIPVVVLLSMYFNCRYMIKGDKNILTLSKEDAQIPFISQNDDMWEYFEPELKRRLSELEVEDSCGARVRSVLIELLPSAENSIEQVALKLGYSKRTLQKKLKKFLTSS